MDNIEITTFRLTYFLKKFDSECMDFHVWLNYFEFLIDVLIVPDDEKLLALLNMIELYTLLVIQKKLINDRVESLSYDFLISTMNNLFSSYQEQYAARYRFDNRNQFYCESVRNYAKTLKKLISKCEFKYDTTSLLLDRLIIGLKSDLAKHKLLQTQNLTLDIAIKLIEIIEIYEDKYSEARRIADELYENYIHTSN
ncbi:hypothetical protein M0804_013853 [Polistes exclamans]|nr:hypothetical protein M0804_013853 [Polistes exclamans]